MNTSTWQVCRLFAIPALILLGGLSAQQRLPSEGSDASQYRIATRSILLDVVVADKKGRPVEDLTKSDFAIVEDGVVQKIASFEAPHLSYRNYNTPSIMVSHAFNVTASTENAEPVTLLILDQLNTQFEDAAYARFSIKRFLQKYRTALLQPTALLALTSSGRAEVVQDFTRDSAKLRSAIERLPATLPAIQEGASADSDADRFGICVAALLDLADVTEQYPGRKNLIWIGSGFTKLTNLGTDNSQRLEQVRRASDRLMKAHVVFSYIDPSGLQLTQARDLTMDVETSNLINVPLQVGAFADFALAALAVQTGGYVSFGNNDVTSALSSSVADGTFCYTLSYYPSNPDWNGAFRRIVVRLSRPGLTAHTRSGYFAIDETAPLSKEQRVIQLARAISSRFAYTQLTLNTYSAKLFQNHGFARLWLTVLPKEVDLRPIARDKMGFEITVAVANLSSNGKIKARVTREMQIAITSPKVEAGANQRVLIKLDAPVKPGTATVRIVAIDDHNGRIGSIEVNVSSLTASSSTYK